MPVRRHPNGRWRYRVSVTIPGREKPLRISGCAPRHNNTKEAAKQAEREHIAQVQRGAAAPEQEPAQAKVVSTEPMRPVEPEKPVMTFGAFASEYMTAYARTNNKPSEQKSKEKILRRYLLPHLGQLPLDAIRAKEIESFKGAMLEEEFARKSVNNMLACLGKTLRYAHELEMLEAVPKIRMLKVEKTKFQFLDFEQYDALLKVAKAEPEWLVAILLGADAGLRQGEIRGLRWDDWDRRNDRITVSRSIWTDIEGTTKGWKLRTVPTTSRLAAALAATRHLRGPTVLADGEGGTLGLEAMRWNLPRLCRQAGITPITWHALRHTFCSHLALRGAPARVIQELAGHASLATTLQYMHLVPGATDDAIALLERRGTTVAKKPDSAAVSAVSS